MFDHFPLILYLSRDSYPEVFGLLQTLDVINVLDALIFCDNHRFVFVQSDVEAIS